MRLIDADALQRRICGAKCGCEYEDCGNEGDCTFDHFISSAHTIDPESLRQKGEWIENGQCNHKPCRIKNPEKWVVYKCSVCSYGNGRKRSNFCPNCGADMRSNADAVD